MKLTLIMTRALSLQSIGGYFPLAGGQSPLAAFSVLSSYDIGEDNASSSAIYAALQTAGLPDSAVVTANTTPFGGVSLITKNGKIVPFKIFRAVHRVGIGARLEAGGITYNPLSYFSDPNISTVSTFDPNRSILGGLQVASRYVVPGQFPYQGTNSEFSIEDNSYITPNGQYFANPGISEGSRLTSGQIPGNYALIKTIVENVAPVNIGASAVGLGRVGGALLTPINGNNLNTQLPVGQSWSTCFITSIWDVEIDDVAVTTASQTNSKIYAVIASATSTQREVRYDQQVGGDYFLGNTASVINIGVLPVRYCAISLLDLPGSSLRTAKQSESVVPIGPGGAPSAFSNGGPINNFIGAGVNLGVFDYVPNF
jgi:hypothetical protein